MSNFTKTISSPDRGVNYNRDPSLLEFREWFMMNGLRARLGVVENFPGWKSILANGQTLGGVATLLYEYTHLDQGNLLICGGPTKLYQYKVSDKTLTDISGAFSFSVNLDNPWFPFQYADTLYLTCKQHGLHKYVAQKVEKIVGASIPIGSRLSDGSVVGADSFHIVPRARSGAILKDHICLLNSVEGGAQNFVWAQEGRNDVWAALVSNDAGDFPLNDTPDEGVALHRLGDDLIAYKTFTTIPIAFVGGNEVFGRREAVNKMGLLGPFALANRGNSHLLMGPDRFYEYLGGARVNDDIGITVNEKVYGEIHPIFKSRSRTCWIRQTQEWLFFYADINSIGAPNKFVIYNTQENLWYGPMEVVQGCGMARGRMDRQISKVINEITSLINATPEIINYALYGTGTPLSIFADSEGQIHEFIGQNANGLPITRVLETGDQTIGLDCQDATGRILTLPIGTIYNVQSLMIELGDVTTLQENIQLQVGYRKTLNDPIAYTPPVDIFSRSGQQEVSNFGRANGRFFRLKITCPNGSRIRLIAYKWVFSVEGDR